MTTHHSKFKKINFLIPFHRRDLDHGRHWVLDASCADLCVLTLSLFAYGTNTVRSAPRREKEGRGNVQNTKYVYIKSTTVYVPSSDLGLSQPLSIASECAPTPVTGGGVILACG
jgi:hypothetical protein